MQREQPWREQPQREQLWREQMQREWPWREHVMSLQGHMAQREHKVSVGSRGSVVQWFGGSEEVSTTKYRQRMRGIQWIAR